MSFVVSFYFTDRVALFSLNEAKSRLMAQTVEPPHKPWIIFSSKSYGVRSIEEIGEKKRGLAYFI